ncbi:hypothetical protein ABTQ33_11095 [Paucilactobacillus suebicus]|uniref:Uncharacterized protein n=1 Tax=Paucilactobacillus suebicus DSM 5007 = KCTC 3549 TaxID=1423807 RepID=A0A0R1W8A0_9LACO|nr:hypothetical protein [Paucilactobacillus suebicus]KRM11817.1 hypothetical protein FD16_GL000487 [Paucilactobacillus suebicus DSM 5007 = KCTC 3549]
MNDELQKWQEQFEERNERKPTEEELETAKKHISRNSNAQHHVRSTHVEENWVNDEDPNNPFPRSQQQQTSNSDAPANGRFAWVFVVGLAALIIVGGIIAFKIGTAHGTSLW